jgi:hypothetical protein
MPSIVLPTIITHSWGYGSLSTAGQMNSVPDGSTGTFLASFQDGFPEITATAEGAGGTPSPQGDVNGILSIITKFQLWVNAGGQFPYNAALSTAIGGYPIGAVVILNTNTATVICTLNGNTNNPNTNMTGWAPNGGLLMATAAAVATAQSTANSAAAAASAAQNTANTALSNAATAIATANTANSNASAALTEANYAVNKQTPSGAVNVIIAPFSAPFGSWTACGLSAGLSPKPLIAQSTGHFLIVITGLVKITAAPNNDALVIFQVFTGIGTAPATGAASPGTTDSGGAYTGSATGPTGVWIPFTVTAILTLNTVSSTPRWFDLITQTTGSTGSTASLSNIQAVATEIS